MRRRFQCHLPITRLSPQILAVYCALLLIVSPAYVREQRIVAVAESDDSAAVHHPGHDPEIIDIAVTDQNVNLLATDGYCAGRFSFWTAYFSGELTRVLP
jgi:hypothetical protein